MGNKVFEFDDLKDIGGWIMKALIGVIAFMLLRSLSEFESLKNKIDEHNNYINEKFEKILINNAEQQISIEILRREVDELKADEHLMFESERKK